MNFPLIKTWRFFPNCRLLSQFALVFSTFTWLWMFLTCIVNVSLYFSILRRGIVGNTGKSLAWIYLVVKEFLVFCCTVVSLKEAIYLPVLKSLAHMCKRWRMNRLWLTVWQIYLYRWYIPDLIRLVNDIETNPGPARCWKYLIAVKVFALVIQVQIYLAVLAIANYFRKLCLTSAEENHVAWHKLDEYETKIN